MLRLSFEKSSVLTWNWFHSFYLMKSVSLLTWACGSDLTCQSFRSLNNINEYFRDKLIITRNGASFSAVWNMHPLSFLSNMSLEIFCLSGLLSFTVYRLPLTFQLTINCVCWGMVLIVKYLITTRGLGDLKALRSEKKTSTR